MPDLPHGQACAVLHVDKRSDHCQSQRVDLSWIGTAVVALAGFGGVWVTVAANARANKNRQDFESGQATDTRTRAERERIYDAVKHMSEEFLAAEYWTTYESEPWDSGPPYDFGEHFPDWLSPKLDRLRQENALIQDATIRVGAQACIETMTFAWGIARNSWRTAPDVIRDATQVGFELTTAWLRDQKPDGAILARLEKIEKALASWKTAEVQQEQGAREARISGETTVTALPSDDETHQAPQAD